VLFRSAGVDRAIPGFRARYAIIDDPIKSRAAANSETEREHVWRWYFGDLERRLIPEAGIVLMHQRWHDDDLAGRLLSVEADRWRVLSLPAEAEENDPLGRAPGEWLWCDDDYGYGAQLPEIKRRLEDAGAASEWWSQYQQRPRRPGGAVFKVAQIPIVDAAPAGGQFVRGWDLAATAEAAGSRDPDWTRGVLLQRTEDARYIVHDVVSVRGGPDEVEHAITSTAARDRAAYGLTVKIGLPQDPGQAGKTQVLYLTRRLARYIVVSSLETGDKATRAEPVASQCNVGNLALIEGAWNRPFLDELAGFPSAAHDDQVDALSRAFSVLVEPMRSEGLFELYRAQAAEAERARKARENGVQQ